MLPLQTNQPPAAHSYLLCRSLSWRVLIVCVLFSIPLVGIHRASGAELGSESISRTLRSISRVKGVTEQDLQRYRPQVTKLSYTAARGVRAFCRLPGISPAQITQSIQLPDLESTPFALIPLLEYYVTLPGATFENSRTFLSQLHNLPFVSEQVLTALPNIQKNSASNCMNIILLLQQHNEAAQWAIQSLFSVNGIDGDTVLSTMELLDHMGLRQQQAAEKCFAAVSLQPAHLQELLQRIAHLHDLAAINVSGLVGVRSMTTHQLSLWIDNYFSTTRQQQETTYLSFSAEEKQLLLAGFSNASATISEQLNNLHGINEAARLQLAHSLTSQNIYALLAHGDELFDSSFRDILVPVLLNRIKEMYRGNLLEFLVTSDPDSHLVANFLNSLAWKGKLTTFLPPDVVRQQKILELLTKSVMDDQQNLIFFSATFTRLLESLLPPARSSLLDLLLGGAGNGNTPFARQLRVILQHYLEYHSQLLSLNDTQRITGHLASYGSVDLAPYITTPFTEWLQDNTLTSISVFQSDDDGRKSYIDNCSYLLHHGYKPRLSNTYVLSTPDLPVAEVENVLTAIAGGNQLQLHHLFQLAERYALVIDWQKQVNTVEIIHSLYVYHGKTAQLQLLKIFLINGHELFAQRGHSYWRNEQLLKPLAQLVDTKELPPEVLTAKQRFISIGSCGGIRAILELNNRFSNTIDTLATVGTGTSAINTPYNTKMFETIAAGHSTSIPLSWQDVATGTRNIFSTGSGEEYIQPGSLPAILYKMTTQTALP